MAKKRARLVERLTQYLALRKLLSRNEAASKSLSWTRKVELPFLSMCFSIFGRCVEAE